MALVVMARDGAHWFLLQLHSDVALLVTGRNCISLTGFSKCFSTISKEFTSAYNFTCICHRLACRASDARVHAHVYRLRPLKCISIYFLLLLPFLLSLISPFTLSSGIQRYQSDGNAEQNGQPTDPGADLIDDDADDVSGEWSQGGCPALDSDCPHLCHCSENVVDCRDRGLLSVPSNLPRNTIEL